MNKFEAAVIEAAYEWENVQKWSKYCCMAYRIKQAEDDLLCALFNLAAENDGRWVMPNFTDAEKHRPEKPFDRSGAVL